MHNFELDGREFIELHNLLKITGMCNSGGQAKRLIADEMVAVDGKIETRKRCKIRAGQCIEFNGESLSVIA